MSGLIFVFISKAPLMHRGFDIIPFDCTKKDISEFDLDKETDIIIGSVESTTEFFNKCNINVPPYLGYPQELKKFLHRDFKLITKKTYHRNIHISLNLLILRNSLVLS